MTNATYEVGFSSSSRLYARVNSHLGMTPSVFRSGGSGAAIRFTTAPTAVGRLLLAVTDRGIAALDFGDSDASLTASLKREFHGATVRRDPDGLTRYVRGILRGLTGDRKGRRLPLDLHATAFQRRVWEALQRIPYGSTRSYRDIARAIGRPNAGRAVGRACATNPIALVIPCHRAVRADGRPGGYRWGLRRKARLLALEQQPARLAPGKARQGSTDGRRR